MPDKKRSNPSRDEALKKAAERDAGKPGMQPKNVARAPSIPPLKKNGDSNIPDHWTQKAFEKKTVKKAKGGMVRGWGCATKGKK